MLDDFLKEEDASSFLNEIDETPKLELSPEPEAGFMGMTPTQRFILALMFFFMVLVIGTFFLLVTGVIAIPVG
ncbi:MAG: hypothetical protein WEA61_06025 [Anaerolineales bacterium]